MYHNKYAYSRASAKSPARAGRARKRMITVLLSVMLLLGMTVGGTVAFLIDVDGPIVNIFTRTQVSCSVTEDFDGTTKSNVNVVNNSNIAAYIRVKLITYRVDASGNHIGGTAEIPEFTLGEGWFEQDGYYYYNQAVAAGAKPAAPLIGADGIKLAAYSDVDGGRQVIEVMAEAIQSVRTSVVKECWKVDVNDYGQLTKKTGGNG